MPVRIEEEMKKLEEKIKLYEEILTNPDKLNSVIKEDLRKIKKEYGIPRRTEIREEVEEIMPVFRACTQCRADAYGIPGKHGSDRYLGRTPQSHY